MCTDFHVPAPRQNPARRRGSMAIPIGGGEGAAAERTTEVVDRLEWVDVLSA